MLFHTLWKFRGTGPRRPRSLTHARVAFSAAAAVLVLAVGAAPAQVSFTTIADTSSGMFSTFGTPFSALSQAPSLSGSVVAFLGNGLAWTAPAAGGAPVPVTFILPGGQPLSSFLSQPATDGSVVAFVGADFSGRPGIYSAPVGGGGTLSVVADTATPVPNGTGNFQSFFNQEPSASSSLVAFSGFASGAASGIYTGPAAGGGPLARVADPNTAVQPSGRSPSLSGTLVALSGFTSGGVSGIYTGPSSGGTLTPVADTNTTIPNGSGHFSSFGSTPAVSGSVVAFIGSGGSGQTGVYTGTVGSGALARVADATSAIPGGSGNFTGFSIVDVSGSVVAFAASGGGSQSGIYFEDMAGGTLTKLVATGDTLSGKTVSTLFFNDGLSGANIAFTAAFTDGSQGIYVGHFTPVPEPVGLLAVGTGLLGLLGWWRTGRAKTGTPLLGGGESAPDADIVVDR